MSDPPVWVLTDGKAGDEQPCIGVAEALGVSPETRRVRPKPPWSWLMPRGPIDPAEAPGRAGSPIAPPYPALAIASGRRAIPYLRKLKDISSSTFTLLLKDPRTGAASADLIWVPEYDALRGPNVITSLTTPHRISAGRLAALRASPDPRLAPLKSPRVAVLAGGDSRHVRFRAADIGRLVEGLRSLAEAGAALMITTSRRTPPALKEALVRVAAASGGFYWDGTGDNPYAAMLALADAIVVTADSANMVGEATATGAAVLLFELPGGYDKHLFLFDRLERYGALRRFTGRLETFTYPPLDSTAFVADAVRRALAARGVALGGAGPLG
ncbi:MAG TPA: mitochondrial fission ELM1 family protein [Hyphomicrobiales bacterium]|nr:mitochondrial fission ELM1 family protein [Hyphomicrobiales bacterium]